MQQEMSKQEIIRTIQLETLENLRVLDRICKKYDIKYFLVYGSLLGAIRHQGFIPWDDDLDIGLMREDYEKLCKVKPEEWGDDAIFVQGTSGLRYHDKIFGRIYRKKSLIQSARDIYEWKDPKNGEAFYTKLMCDLYVYDYAPDNDSEYEAKKKKLKRLASGYKKTKFKARSNGSVSSMIKTFIKNRYGGFMRLTDKTPWKTLADKYNAIAAGKAESKRICNYPVDTTLLPVEKYFPLRTAKFEDMEVPVPNDYDAVLKKEYGNYMEYPKKEDRYHIQFIYADLGNGTKFIIDPIPGSLGEKESKK